jgi:hypothetical protein
MTSPVRSSYNDALAAVADLQHMQRWQAAQTVRAHVHPTAGRDDVLECLGLSDVTRPGDA